ncbi:hypothetical protein B0H19DRAFT_1256648 [Mycena capillaripes]|nr:hypothetical protein B0H19DRAFT_1256648 [Mycena capillaripes]
MASLQQDANYQPTLLGIPTELRIRIYEHLFTDLIEELSDNLFAVFSLYDHLYNYTSAYLDSHVGRTELTPILRTNRQIHDEALSVLCEHAEFIIDVSGGDDSDDEERAAIRLSEAGCQQVLAFARNLKVNIQPESSGDADRFIRRCVRFLDAIQNGANLRSLKLFVNAPGEMLGKESMERILDALAVLRTRGNSIQVYLGNVGEEQVSDERLTLLLDAINGDNMGRGHNALEPSRWGDGESDMDSDERRSIISEIEGDMYDVGDDDEGEYSDWEDD